MGFIFVILPHRLRFAKINAHGERKFKSITHSLAITQNQYRVVTIVTTADKDLRLKLERERSASEMDCLLSIQP